MKISNVTKWLRVCINICIVGFVAFIMTGCLHRDPFVIVGNGYGIVAICWSCPCELIYQGWKDERSYSGWKAMRHGDEFLLLNNTAEGITFDSEAEWKQAICDKNAAPENAVVSDIKDVTAFAADKSFVIGHYSGGFFLLDMQANWADKWESKEEWAQAVSSRTQLSPDRLKDPKAWFVLIMSPWITAPLWSKRRGMRLF